MNEKQLKILFLSSWYPSRVHTTLGNFNKRFAQAVALKSKVTVLYITSDKNLSKREIEIEKKVVDNLTEYIVYVSKIGSRILAYQKGLKTGIKRITEDAGFDFDIIHGNILLKSGLQALYIKRKVKDIPFVVTENWTGYHDDREKRIGFIKTYLLKVLAKKADRLLPVTNQLKESMESCGLEGKYSIVPNVVNTDLFSPEKEEKRHSKFQILHVSTLDDHHKNISGILRVIKEISKKRSDFHLSIVGDGDIVPHLNYAKELGIPDALISFAGQQDSKGIAKFMQGSDLFLMFSNYENLPCVILESYSTGTPVISTDVGGIREHINDKLGILIKRGDEKELKEGLIKAMDHYEMFDKDYIRNYAVDRFSEESVSRQFHDIYHEILSEKK